MRQSLVVVGLDERPPLLCHGDIGDRGYYDQ